MSVTETEAKQLYEKSIVWFWWLIYTNWHIEPTGMCAQNYGRHLYICLFCQHVHFQLKGNEHFWNTWPQVWFSVSSHTFLCMVMYVVMKPNAFGSVSITADLIAKQHLVWHTAVELDLAVIECNPNAYRIAHSCYELTIRKCLQCWKSFPRMKNVSFQCLCHPK